VPRVVWVVTCADESVEKIVASVPQDEFYIVPVSYKGRNCHRAGWGLYEDETRAETALRSIPDYFHPGVAPKVVLVSAFLR
jgi:hypothetical protein